MRIPTVNLRTMFAVVAISFFMLAGCHYGKEHSFSADISTASTVPGMPGLSGKLYVKGNHLKADWGQFADVFDIKTRTGWRVIPAAHRYEPLGSKDLSTYAPEMTDGSICPHAQVPSACKLIGTETVDGRKAKKWDVFSPNRFHIYFWTDQALGITLRMAIGDAASYEVKSLHQDGVADSIFELPAGYERLDRSSGP